MIEIFKTQKSSTIYEDDKAIDANSTHIRRFLGFFFPVSK